jgi:hypothetical protein
MGRLNANQTRELALSVSENPTSDADGGPEREVHFHLFFCFLEPELSRQRVPASSASSATTTQIAFFHYTDAN